MAVHPLDNLEGYRVFLASASPRRRQLLSMLDIEFETAPVIDIEESYPDILPAELVPVHLSKLKAAAYSSMFSDSPTALIITADTVVILEEEILGKPFDRNEAIKMLTELSGKQHRVVTGVTLSSAKDSISFYDTSFVTFRCMTNSEICYYVDKYTPFDKAGAYGIQEWIGAVGIEKLEGSFYNVMGLPVEMLYQQMKTFPKIWK